MGFVENHKYVEWQQPSLSCTALSSELQDNFSLYCNYTITHTVLVPLYMMHLYCNVLSLLLQLHNTVLRVLSSLNP